MPPLVIRRTNRALPLPASSSSSGIVLFDPGDLGQYANHDQIFTVDTNDHDGGFSTLQSAVTRPGGSSKCLRIDYPNDDAGTQWMFPAFAPTPTLYYRWYMMLDSSWPGHYPVGLKTSRTFTRSDYIAVPGDVGVDGDAYTSPKLVWQKYQDKSGFCPDNIGGDPNATDVWGCCIACNNLDIGAAYSPTIVFSSAWVLCEFFQQINSGNGTADGILTIKLNKTTVYNNTALKYVDSLRYVPNGLAGWRSMWFGGNASYSATAVPPGFPFPTGTTLKRYEDSPFASTNARWVP
jgi:hypothetical protein